MLHLCRLLFLMAHHAGCGEMTQFMTCCNGWSGSEVIWLWVFNTIITWFLRLAGGKGTTWAKLPVAPILCLWKDYIPWLITSKHLPTIKNRSGLTKSHSSQGILILQLSTNIWFMNFVMHRDDCWELNQIQRKEGEKQKKREGDFCLQNRRDFFLWFIIKLT